MSMKAEAWYIHAALYLVIVVLTFLLIKVAIIDPKNVVSKEKYNRNESRLRMSNLKEAQILYQKKYGTFTDNLDTLINFVKYDPFVDSVVNAFDTISRRPSNPFRPLSSGEFTPDSLYRAPRSQQQYIVQIDTSTTVDTVVNRRGNVIRVDTATAIGGRYYIEDPDGYGTVGSLEIDNLRNTASWE
jgi:hypothetical protein